MAKMLFRDRSGHRRLGEQRCKCEEGSSIEGLRLDSHWWSHMAILLHCLCEADSSASSRNVTPVDLMAATTVVNIHSRVFPILYLKLD